MQICCRLFNSSSFICSAEVNVDKARTSGLSVPDGLRGSQYASPCAKSKKACERIPGAFTKQKANVLHCFDFPTQYQRVL